MDRKKSPRRGSGSRSPTSARSSGSSRKRHSTALKRSLLQLPHLVLDRIFDFLEWKVVAKVMPLVCKDCHQLARRDFLWFSAFRSAFPRVHERLLVQRLVSIEPSGAEASHNAANASGANASNANANDAENPNKSATTAIMILPMSSRMPNASSYDSPARPSSVARTGSVSRNSSSNLSLRSKDNSSSRVASSGEEASGLKTHSGSKDGLRISPARAGNTANTPAFHSSTPGSSFATPATPLSSLTASINASNPSTISKNSSLTPLKSTSSKTLKPSVFIKTADRVRCTDHLLQPPDVPKDYMRDLDIALFGKRLTSSLKKEVLEIVEIGEIEEKEAGNAGRGGEGDEADKKSNGQDRNGNANGTNENPNPTGNGQSWLSQQTHSPSKNWLKFFKYVFLTQKRNKLSNTQEDWLDFQSLLGGFSGNRAGTNSNSGANFNSFNPNTRNNLNNFSSFNPSNNFNSSFSNFPQPGGTTAFEGDPNEVVVRFQETVQLKLQREAEKKIEQQVIEESIKSAEKEKEGQDRVNKDSERRDVAAGEEACGSGAPAGKQPMSGSGKTKSGTAKNEGTTTSTTSTTPSSSSTHVATHCPENPSAKHTWKRLWRDSIFGCTACGRIHFCGVSQLGSSISTAHLFHTQNSRTQNVESTENADFCEFTREGDAHFVCIVSGKIKGARMVNEDGGGVDVNEGSSASSSSAAVGSSGSSGSSAVGSSAVSSAGGSSAAASLGMGSAAGLGPSNHSPTNAFATGNISNIGGANSSSSSSTSRNGNSDGFPNSSRSGPPAGKLTPSAGRNTHNLNTNSVYSRGPGSQAPQKGQSRSVYSGNSNVTVSSSNGGSNLKALQNSARAMLGEHSYGSSSRSGRSGFAGLNPALRRGPLAVGNNLDGHSAPRPNQAPGPSRAAPPGTASGSASSASSSIFSNNAKTTVYAKKNSVYSNNRPVGSAKTLSSSASSTQVPGQQLHNQPHPQALGSNRNPSDSSSSASSSSSAVHANQGFRPPTSATGSTGPTVPTPPALSTGPAVSTAVATASTGVKSSLHQLLRKREREEELANDEAERRDRKRRKTSKGGGDGAEAGNGVGNEAGQSANGGDFANLSYNNSRTGDFGELISPDNAEDGNGGDGNGGDGNGEDGTGGLNEGGNDVHQWLPSVDESQEAGRNHLVDCYNFGYNLSSAEAKKLGLE